MTKITIPVAKPQVGQEEVDAVARVVRSGQYASGPEVAEFEREFAKWNGSEYAVAVSSGTAALHIAMEAIGVSPGDEVIVPPLTFFATVSSVLYLGATPVFADIDGDDLCLSPESVAEVVTEKTKCILPVHLFGASAKMDKLLSVADKHGVPILEDCAQAHGTTFGGRKVGSIGRAGAFSFFATKHMTTGEGGMVTTDDEGLAQAARSLRSHGMEGRDKHIRLAYNNRMTEMGGAMGGVQLAKLDGFNERRIANSKFIHDAARELDWAEIPVPSGNRTHTFFWCPIMVKPESGKCIDNLKQHLLLKGIGFRHRYTEPLYRQPVLADISPEYAKLNLPNVERIAGNVIGLPNHPGLTSDERNIIVEALRTF